MSTLPADELIVPADAKIVLPAEPLPPDAKIVRVPAGSILTTEDYEEIDAKLQEWRDQFAQGGRSPAREYALEESLLHLDQLERDIRLCRTAPDLKGTIIAHVDLAIQIERLLNGSSKTAEERMALRKRINASTMKHMLACDAAVKRHQMKLKDRQALIGLSAKMREMVIGISSGKRRR